MSILRFAIVGRRFAFAAAASAALVSAAHADLLNLSGGNLVLMRGGDDNHSNNDPNAVGSFANGEVPAFLDEYSVSVSGGVATANYVGPYSIPTGTLTLPGIQANSHEGRLNLSGDGKFINFGGYQQAVSSSTPRVTNNSGTGTYYQIGQVSGGLAYTSASLDTAKTKPQFVRALYSDDGTQAWVATKSPTGGLAYVSGIGGATTTVALQNTTDWRDVKVAAGQLYGGTGSSSVGVHGFYAIGSGEPTAPIPSNLLLSYPAGANESSVSAFSMATIPTLPGGPAQTQPINGVSGPNVVYAVGSQPSNNLVKLYVDPTKSLPPLAANELIWAGGSQLSLIPANFGSAEPEGVLAKTDPDNSAWVDLFIQAKDGVYFSVDKSGSTSGSIAALTFTKIISPVASGSFYGISSAPVPEPSSVVLAGMAAVGAFGAARRRLKS